jgi:hypothetical protein
MTKKITHALSVLGLALMASALASADVIDFSLVNPPLVAYPGTVLSFSATVSAPVTNGAPVFLNADSTTIDYPLTLDDSPFFNNFPLSLSPGSSFTGLLFTVTVPTYVTVLNYYNGYFEIDGGADSSAGDDLASVNFQIEAVPPVPEPGNAVLPLVGLAGIVLMVLRRKRCTEPRG